ncbi:MULTISPECIES: helix-turn-helix domain-containing protein [Dietzia]|uniref:helix-turn-helix domain-containing protein n=1 Tax=Dietzia TaxID=37914 RepID=UPI003556C1D6
MADGDANAAIAREVGVCEDTARRWRHRFCLERLEETPPRSDSSTARLLPWMASAGRPSVDTPPRHWSAHFGAQRTLPRYGKSTCPGVGTAPR